MPDYFQSSPWTDAANAGEGIGDSIGRMLFQLPQLRRQIALQQAELGLKQQQIGQEGQYQRGMLGQDQQRINMARQLQGVQMPDIQAQTAQSVAETAKINQGLESAKRAAQLEDLVKSLVMERGQLNNPATANNPNVLAGVLQQLQSVGAAPQGVGVGPQGPMPVSNQDVTGLIDNAIRANLVSRAVETPASAVNLVSPYTVGPGYNLADPLQTLLSGATVQGQPRPATGQKNQDAVMYDRALRFESNYAKLPLSERNKPENTQLHQQAQQILSKVQGGYLGGGTNSPSGRVKVRSRDGRVGTVPSEQLQDALNQGYQQVP